MAESVAASTDKIVEGKKRYSLTEVATHNQKRSSWLIIHDNVYDVTKFLEEVSDVPARDEIERHEMTWYPVSATFT